MEEREDEKEIAGEVEVERYNLEREAIGIREVKKMSWDSR